MSEIEFSKPFSVIEHIVSADMEHAPPLRRSEHGKGCFTPDHVRVHYTKAISDVLWDVVVVVRGAFLLVSGETGLLRSERSFTGLLTDIPDMNGGEMPQWLADFVKANIPACAR